MFETQIQIVADLLAVHTVLQKGLTDKQINDAEEFYRIKFPPDLKALLMCFCPPFYDWNNYSKDNVQGIKKALRWPVEGILFDVKANNFWMEHWGARPEDMETALQIAKANLATVPPLVPIYGHRYIPCNPLEAGNPVYSVYQTDIIYYGQDLWGYFTTEFRWPYIRAIDFDKIRKDIPFWGEMVT